MGINLYCDCGHVFNSPTSLLAGMFAQNVYNSQNWRVTPSAVVTNTVANTYVRAPGTTQGVAIIENVMEHAAAALGTDPLEFRLNNLLKKGDKMIFGGEFEEESNPIANIIDQLRRQSKYDQRKLVVEEFNKVKILSLPN